MSAPTPIPISLRVRNRILRSAVGRYVPGGGERRNYPASVAVNSANADTIEFLKTTDASVVAEIGVYRGHTSHEIASWLAGRGQLHLYDFKDTAERVEADLRAAGYTNVQTFTNSYKYLDSYNWSLARVLEANSEPIYDYVFIDGAHTWAVDALTTLLVDRLLKPGGYLDFDDYGWTLAASAVLKPSVFPLTAKMFTEEQINAQQIKMICDLLVRRDDRYEEVRPNKIFRKMRA